MATEGIALWLDGPEPPPRSALAAAMDVDVAIVGAGMAGLHCAHALRDSGLSVAVFEARRIGGQATGKSTAKVTSQHGMCYARLVRDFGRDGAQRYATANQRAVEAICGLCAQMPGQAGLERRDAWLIAEIEDEAHDLKDEAETAARLGLPARLEGSAAQPLPAAGFLAFANQAQIDPVAYLRGLADLLPPGIRLFERSRVTAVEPGETVTLTVNGHRVRARHAVIATQLPVVAEGTFFTRAHVFAHPVAAAPLPEGVAVQGMFKTVGSPSRSFRTAMRGQEPHLVAAGMEFTPGDARAQAAAVEDLRELLRRHFSIGNPSHLWINEDFRAIDGAAFVGAATPDTPNLLVATGFSAWGLTQGAVAGDVLAAAILGRDHPAAALFDATRKKPLAGAANFVAGNVTSGVHMLKDRLPGHGADHMDDIGPGQGGVVSRGGDKLAVRRDPDGTLHVLSALCTHMGCVVGWNAIDRTWDCPCHGSRFDCDGAVLAGPATAPLEPRDPVTGEKRD